MIWAKEQRKEKVNDRGHAFYESNDGCRNIEKIGSMRDMETMPGSQIRRKMEMVRLSRKGKEQVGRIENGLHSGELKHKKEEVDTYEGEGWRAVTGVKDSLK